MPDHIEQNGTLVGQQHLEEIQEKEDKKNTNVKNIGKGVFIAAKLLYSCSVSLIFASLSAKNDPRLSLKLPYATTSFYMNFTQSWVFTEYFIKWLKKIGKKTKNKDLAYLPTFIVGIAATAITAVSMIKPAQDAVNGSDNDLVKALAYKNIGVALMEFNTISTRIVATTEIGELITSAIQWLLSRMCEKDFTDSDDFEKPLDGLYYVKNDLDNALKNLSTIENLPKYIKNGLNDLKKLQEHLTHIESINDKDAVNKKISESLKQINETVINLDNFKQNLHDFNVSNHVINVNDKNSDVINKSILAKRIKNFYTFTEKNGISIADSAPIHPCISVSQKLPLIIFYTIAIYLCIATTPTWLNMTEKGLNALEIWDEGKNHTQLSPWGNDAALVWGGAFSNIFLCIYLTLLMPHTISRITRKSVVATGSRAKGTALASTFLVLMAIIGALSGAGMSFEAKDGQINGFGNVANSTYLNSPIINPLTNFVYPILPFILMLVCGVFVNATSGAELSFKAGHWLIQKLPSMASVNLFIKTRCHRLANVFSASNNRPEVLIESAQSSYSQESDSSIESIETTSHKDQILTEYYSLGLFLEDNINKFKDGFTDDYPTKEEISDIKNERDRCKHI